MGPAWRHGQVARRAIRHWHLIPPDHGSCMISQLCTRLISPLPSIVPAPLYRIFTRQLSHGNSTTALKKRVTPFSLRILVYFAVENGHLAGQTGRKREKAAMF